MAANPLREIPSVNDLLAQTQDLIAVEGHQRVVDALRVALDSVRETVLSGEGVGVGMPSAQEIVNTARHILQPLDGAGSTKVINATGVIIHTNLGRSVLSAAAQRAMIAVASDYSPLEFNLLSGQRGQRGMSVEKLICQLTGAEDALVVNNCAAATVLMLTALAQDQSVVISRGQLVEIGGGFRIPDIMAQSRARLIEVGTTNRTRVSDYEKALRDHDDVAALLRVHSSNFKMVGFTHEVGVSELVALASQREPAIPVLDDIGSGALLDTQAYGLSHEPMPQESIKAGVAIVTFSGDKLLGGPQAGILAGKREYINRCRLHPLARAFRADKYTLAALGATILHYLRGEATHEVPVWRMIAMHKDDIARRSLLLIRNIQPWIQRMGYSAELVDGESTIGGGSLPGETLPTTLVVLHSTHAMKLANTLRAAPVPIITRIQENHVILDLRTVLDDQVLTDSILNIP